MEDIRGFPNARCHELVGDRKGTLAVDLGHPYRLIFEPNHIPIPRKVDGGLDWTIVTAIRILAKEKLVELCANAGVAVVLVRELPNIGIGGATQWIAPDKALIQLRLRYKTDDEFWFTFFHEVGHILLHAERQIFLEIDEAQSKTVEQEADNFSKNTLVDTIQWKKFMSSGYSFSEAEIKQFAREVKVAPGIIVGRLQQEKLLSYTQRNELKRSLVWSEL
ncbi:MAG: ImmA/IrrE family metallo-endopeptidase [Ktedonobacteraceae bacterium]|nr:ImmA/IrrE family metallo-endopeptidase [Ktedonobacteraceae bacterium]